MDRPLDPRRSSTTLAPQCQSSPATLFLRHSVCTHQIWLIVYAYVLICHMRHTRIRRHLTVTGLPLIPTHRKHQAACRDTGVSRPLHIARQPNKQICLPPSLPCDRASFTKYPPNQLTKRHSASGNSCYHQIEVTIVVARARHARHKVAVSPHEERQVV